MQMMIWQMEKVERVEAIILQICEFLIFRSDSLVSLFFKDYFHYSRGKMFSL